MVSHRRRFPSVTRNVRRQRDSAHPGFAPCLAPGGLGLPRQFRLGLLDQLFHADGVRFLMPVARERVGPARRFDQDIRPDQPGLDMHRRHFAQADRHFIHPKPGAFAPADRPVRHLDVGGEQKVASCPAAGSKDFCWHIAAFPGGRWIGRPSAGDRPATAEYSSRSLAAGQALPPVRGRPGGECKEAV